MRFFCYLLLFTHLVFAQKRSSRAKELLDGVSKNIESFENITLNFRIQHISENFEKFESEGTIILKQNKYLLNFMESIQLFDGKKVYQIMDSEKEINISNHSHDNSSINPVNIFTLYKKGFETEMDIVQKVQKRLLQYIKLTPKKDINKEIDYILLAIEKEKIIPYKIIQINKNKSKTTIEITKFETNTELGKDTFSFDEKKYKDYFINRID
ncbi:hypothetical protein JBKA6_0673 [Ichthyobacterium seriolicida]|uniref:Outer membrane lipoprotein carrier protein LolA n=2 Tax=Ichthyobacterium seriolicida TaxID=242600 RepID=A0A1J1E5U1_9FLAO|nr:hypothetical protein JBKA6_0673 [Ichthyobacterium seriolicida]